MKNYEDYSLDNLSEWLHDSMQSGATPEMIYNKIISCIDLDIEYHESCLTQAKQLKRLIVPQQTICDTDNVFEYQSIVNGLTNAEDLLS